ncbi:MAG: DNA polymerase III subunit delta [Deltaproteobacteria bacterium]|nr:DNA polymerase III subunit delta [Deltaproteobacteria bacterium]
MKPDQFQKDLRRGNIPPICLLYGEERLLIGEALNSIRKNISTRQGETPEEEIFYGGESDPASILQSLRTFSLFAANKLIVVKDFHRMNDAGRNLFLGYLEDTSENTWLVLLAEKVDLRKKFYARLQKKKFPVVRFYHPYDAAATERWIRGYLKAYGFGIDREAIRFLYEAHGRELQILKNELDKLMLYRGKTGEIDLSDVAGISGQSREYTPFELADVLADRNLEGALRIFHRLTEDGAPPVLLHAILISKIRKLRQGKCLEEEGATDREILAALGVRFQGDRFLRQCRGFTGETLEGIYEELLSLDAALKSSCNRPETLMELLICRICRGEALCSGGDPVHLFREN